MLRVGAKMQRLRDRFPILLRSRISLAQLMLEHGHSNRGQLCLRGTMLGRQSARLRGGRIRLQLCDQCLRVDLYEHLPDRCPYPSVLHMPIQRDA